MRHVVCTAIAAIALGVTCPVDAHGQETPSQEPQVQGTEAAPVEESPWSFRVTSYLWFAGLSGDVGARGRVADVDVKFGEIFDALDWFPRRSCWPARFAMAVSPFSATSYTSELEDGGRGPGGLVSAKMGLDVVVWTFGGSYRVIQYDPVTLDLLAGGRLWNLDAEVTISGPGGGALRGSDNKTWVDPIIGVAGRVKLGERFALQAEGDVGGFGLNADIEWQVVGTLQYQLNDSISLEAGYRYLAVDYDDGGFLFDVALHGPIIGASFRF